MFKVMTAAILVLGLTAGGALAQTSGSGSGNSSNNGGGAATGNGNGNNGGASGGATNTQQNDSSGAIDKCKTGAGGTTSTNDVSTTDQQAQNCK